MRPIARAIGLLAVVALVVGCSRFAGLADDLSEDPPAASPW